MENINSLDDLFNKVELYAPIKIKVFNKNGGLYEINDEELNHLKNLLGVNQKTITTFCKWCNREYAFNTEPKLDFITGYNRPLILFAKNSYIRWDDGHTNCGSICEEQDLFKKVNVSFYSYEFICTKEPNHRYKMFLFIERNKDTLTIIKIGQYPSMIDVWGFDFEKYKRELAKIDGYNDFKKAELCNADSFDAGAYTYLRRVFEKMLNSYCAGKELKDNRSETKIKASKDAFDERIHPMLTNLYKILSKGIHQLSDEECSNYYQYLRGVIVMQLEHLKQKEDKQKQSEELNKRLSEIASKI